MIAVLQRVRTASITAEGSPVAAIGQGLLVLLGIAKDDSDRDVSYMADKISQIRIFSDEAGKMNRSIQDMQGELLVVSQFTLLANSSKGRRPSFEAAALPEEARLRYHQVLDVLSRKGIPVQAGIFGGNMLVSLENDGPVTLILDSRAKNTVQS